MVGIDLQARLKKLDVCSSMTQTGDFSELPKSPNSFMMLFRLTSTAVVSTDKSKRINLRLSSGEVF